jgi:hypothetical protein
VLIEKVCFAFAQVLFVIFGSLLIVNRAQLPTPVWLSMLCAGALMAAGIGTFLLLQKYGKLGVFLRWLVQRRIGGRLMENAAARLNGVDDALTAFYRERPWDMWAAVGWHLIGFSVGIVQTWYFLHLLRQDTSLAVAAAAMALGMWFDLVTFAIPLNAGSLEGGRIVAFKAVGCAPLVGMTCGVALRLAQLFWAGVGLVFYGLLTMRAHKAEKMTPVPSDEWMKIPQSSPHGRRTNQTPEIIEPAER